MTSLDNTNGINAHNASGAAASSVKMMKAAEFVLATGKVKQVILLQHPPRYDTVDLDPEGVWAKLAKLANMELHQARDGSHWAENVMVGEHSGLECEGLVRKNRFTSDQSHFYNKCVPLGQYDGVHMYSQEG